MSRRIKSMESGIGAMKALAICHCDTPQAEKHRAGMH